MSQVRITPDEDKLQRLEAALHAAELELSNRRRAVSEAQHAYALAKRRHAKAQKDLWAAKGIR